MINTCLLNFTAKYRQYLMNPLIEVPKQTVSWHKRKATATQLCSGQTSQQGSSCMTNNCITLICFEGINQIPVGIYKKSICIHSKIKFQCQLCYVFMCRMFVYCKMHCTWHTLCPSQGVAKWTLILCQNSTQHVLYVSCVNMHDAQLLLFFAKKVL